MKINPGKSNAIRFTRARVKNPLDYSLGDPKIPESSSCKYLGIILRSVLNWVDQVNYKVQKAWKTLLFVMRVLINGNRNTKSLATTSLVRPILEYRSARWDPRRGGEINALDRVQKKAAQFTKHMMDSDWETLAQHRTIACLCRLFKAYSGEEAWKAIHNRLQRSYYLSRVDHIQKIRDKKKRSDVGKYSFVNRTIKNWNQLPPAVMGTFPCKPEFFETELEKQL